MLYIERIHNIQSQIALTSGFSRGELAGMFGIIVLLHNPNALELEVKLAIIDGTKNSALYQKILKKNVQPSVCDLKLKRSWVMQQENVPKHISKSTSEWLKQNKIKVLEWPSQRLDFNLIEMLWHDLKQSIYAQNPSNVTELKQFCKEEWAKIPPRRCERLIASYRKRLIAVIAAKCDTTSYWI